MKFGRIPVSEAEGAILAHAVVAGDQRLKKAHVLTAADVQTLQRAGLREVIGARLEPGDLSEDDAAERIARALRFGGVTTKPAATGRVNLHAESAGVFTVDKALVDAINRIHPAITLATLAPHANVDRGQMVATVKIIPFAVADSLVGQAEQLAAGREAFRVHPYRAWKVGIAQTTLPGVKPSVLDKTRRVTEARLARSGSHVAAEERPTHETAELAAAIRGLLAGNDLVVAFGASAMCDFDDVVPAAIRAAGGRVVRAGMPVDPGNLIVLGEIDGKPVVGAPGCARSPKENGFDWVLDRLLAGFPVDQIDIAGMGVGGLLMEIPSRPQPREPLPRERKLQVEAIVLAAGRSSRMGGPNKLLALFGDEPLVRRTVQRALASSASAVTVVTGHQADRVEAALFGLDVRIAGNPDHTSGLASSLRAGIAALPGEAAGALILLGDMPDISTAHLDRLIEAFVATGARSVVRATHGGKRGNPVILPRSLFPSVARLQGDTGARHLIEAGDASVVDIEIGEGAGVDVDTPEALRAAGGVLQE